VCKLYRGGPAWLEPDAPTPPEFKVEAVKFVTEQGYSIAEAARSLGLNENLVRSWKLAPEPKAPRPSPAEYEQSE
jgi:transposase